MTRYTTHPGIPALELQSIAVETLSQTGTAYGTWLRYETKFERQYDRAFKDWSRYQQLAMKKILFAPMPDPLPDLPEAASPTKLASNVQNALGRSAPPFQVFHRCRSARNHLLSRSPPGSDAHWPPAHQR